MKDVISNFWIFLVLWVITCVVAGYLLYSEPTSDPTEVPTKVSYDHNNLTVHKI
jgi:hypothetical protein